jgi:hypothetical protein
MAMSAAVRPMPWIMAVVGKMRSTPPALLPEAQSISFFAEPSMPSATCGT